MPSSAPAPTTPNRQPPMNKRRTAGSKRVYGKRKADAPRAVFEQRSPGGELGKSTGTRTSSDTGNNDAVDNLQVKMASVTIEEAGSVTGEENKKEEEQKVVEKPPVRSEKKREKRVVDDPHPEPEAHIGDLEVHNEEAHIQQSSEDTTIAKPQYETMVEVHIPKKPASESDGQQAKDSTITERRKRDTTTATRKKKPAARLSSGCVQDEKANEYTRSILNEALSPIAAQAVQKFNSWAARGGNMLQVVKIAEGSYGEVYKLRLREEVCKQEMSKTKLARLRAYGDGVFKVIPLRAAKGAGSKKFTSVEEIVSEVKMLKYLDAIPGFARFREIHVVQGRFPESFQDAWDYYKKTKDDCMNPNPASKRAYPDSQMWAIIEMDDAGCELEKFSWSSMFQIYDIFWGVAMALARAEEYALFEVSKLPLGEIKPISNFYPSAPGSSPWKCLHPDNTPRQLYGSSN